MEKKYQNKDQRPWGFFCVISDEKTYKVKKIVVYPGKRLSLQRHKYRNEHWFILSGQATVTLGTTSVALLSGESVDIPKGFLHRIENTGPDDVSYIEIQTGDYFGEDDIERIEDDFGRV
jgi:mannose-6-phosphate isomerase